jgi:hypothetical protein
LLILEDVLELKDFNVDLVFINPDKLKY